MKITLNWLKDYVDFDGSPDELAHILTLLGLEVESIDYQRDPFEGIVVARVETRDPHPDAEKLSVCQVHDGQGLRQIVCGARNFQPGDRVPLILPGFSLPPKSGDEKPFVIKVGKLRGVESQGMMCSGRELGLTSDSDGLMILDPGAEAGTPLSRYLGRTGGDVVFDLETTPNRPDWNSLIGIAREVAAKINKPLKIPLVNLPQSSAQPAGSLVAVRIESPDLCPKYTARVIRNIQVAPSPSWLAERLEKMGIRSINNVVDVTNYVMLETGQPLHAFDFHLLGKKSDVDKPCIVVRAAADQEEFTTLDGQVRRLDSGMALIADEVHAIALAGVMGGLNTEISDSTRDVLLESAAFSESATRRTSKVLGLRTDASYRFERGTDWNMVDYASQRAAALILELAGGELSPGSVEASPGVPFHRTVSLRFQKTHDLLGITIPTDAQISMLSNLGITPVPAPTPDATQQDFLIPSNRQDIKREVDLIEEIIRLYGIDHITSTPPSGCIGENPFDSQFDAIAGARHILASMGLHEAQGQTLIERSKAIDFQEQPIALNYPLSSDMDVLRPSLIPGLIDAMEHNSHHNAESISLFEIGRTFQVQQSSGEARQMESRTLAVALSGRADTPFWGGKDKDRLFDFADIKGILEELMEQIGVPVFQLQSQAQPKASWVEAADIKLGKNCLGFIGQLHPVLQKKRDIRKPAFLFELDLDMLLRLSNKSGKFKALPLYPATVRDIALLVPESVTHEEILQTIRRLKVKILESIQLFDIFRGSNVPGGYKSLAYSLTYRDSERTLTDKDVQKAHDQIVENLKSSVQATIR